MGKQQFLNSLCTDDMGSLPTMRSLESAISVSRGEKLSRKKALECENVLNDFLEVQEKLGRRINIGLLIEVLVELLKASEMQDKELNRRIERNQGCFIKRNLTEVRSTFFYYAIHLEEGDHFTQNYLITFNEAMALFDKFVRILGLDTIDLETADADFKRFRKSVVYSPEAFLSAYDIKRRGYYVRFGRRIRAS